MDTSHLSALFEYATEGIILAQGNGAIFMANPAALLMFGYEDAADLIGSPIEKLIPARYRSEHIKYREQFALCPQHRVMGHGRDLFGQKKNGQEFPVEVSLGFYYRENELFVVAFVVDITERKKIETSRKEIQLALEKEKQLNEIKSRFMSIASHEFRTPLSTILSSAALLSKYVSAEDHPRREQHVEKIKSSVRGLNGILEDFLSLGKLEEGKITIRPFHFNLTEFIAGLTEEVQPFLKPGQEIIVKHVGPDTTLTDKRILKNILSNLLTNAIKFSPDGAPIVISIINSERSLNIDIIDKGIGIPEDEIEFLFSSFYRARNAINIQGTGLGLHIIQRYVKLLGGTIHVTTKVNRGTTFTLKLSNYSG